MAETNHIGSKGVEYITELKQLTGLYIPYNNIGDEGAKIIASRMKQLTNLDIRYNQIDPEIVDFLHKEIPNTNINTYEIPNTYEIIDDEEEYEEDEYDEEYV